MILSTGFSHAEAIYMNNDDQQPRPSRHFKCMWTILARTGPTFMTTASTRVRLHMCRTVPPHAARKTPRDASACIRSPPGTEATEPPPPSRSRAPLGCCGPSHIDVWAASTARARQHESASAHLAVGPAPPALCPRRSEKMWSDGLGHRERAKIRRDHHHGVVHQLTVLCAQHTTRSRFVIVGRTGWNMAYS